MDSTGSDDFTISASGTSPQGRQMTPAGSRDYEFFGSSKNSANVTFSAYRETEMVKPNPKTSGFNVNALIYLTIAFFIMAVAVLLWKEWSKRKLTRNK